MLLLFRKLRTSESGVAVLELGLAAPILAVMVIGIIDLSNAFSRKLTLEQAAQRGVEKIMQTTDDDTVDTTIVTEIAAAAKIPVSKVVMTTRLECTNKTSGELQVRAFTTDCDPATEYEARYIEVVIDDEFTPMFPIKFGANTAGKYPMRVKVGMRTQ